MKDSASSNPSARESSAEEASGQSESSLVDNGKCFPGNVRSPFNMTSNLESEAKSQGPESQARGKEDLK